MHDLVHDLAISLLGSQVLDQSKQGNTRRSSCKYALLSDCSKPLELCLTSPEKLLALRFLYGSRSKLISGAAFAPARFLQVLDLSECSKQKLPDSIGELKQLRYLSAPRIEDQMVPECITNLSNLVYLNLYGSSRIERLPESIGKMGSLMHLDLSGWLSIVRLPVSFGNLEKLVYLDLSNCSGISCLVEPLRSLSRLEHLNLSYCRSIGHLTGAMGGLTELQYLNLSYVSCFGLQQDLANLTKLTYLNLSGCLRRHTNLYGLVDVDGLANGVDVDDLLDCVSRLSNLECLNLGYNDKLCAIPETIGKLTKLNTLDLSSCCNLQRLPASLSAMNSLKFLNVFGCSKLDKSTLPQNKNSSVLLPHFMVHAADGASTSNLSELEDKYPTLLEVRRLENVKSAEEAKRIKLMEKQSIGKLVLAWTRDAKRFVDDSEVLRRLEPPDTLKTLRLIGYNGISFPSWMMSIGTYLPHLQTVVLADLPSCNVLPPLGQLPNLQSLRIRGMDSIRKIDGDLYGGRSAFPKLEEFYLSDMECLEEWSAAYCIGEDGLNELVFPQLNDITIYSCPLLRLKACLPPCDHQLTIGGSDKVLLSSWENRGHVRSAATTLLWVSCCKAPLHQWSLIRHLPSLTEMHIINCSDLTCNSTDLLQCISSLKTLIVDGSDRKNTVVLLPERLGDLTSLTNLEILNCKGIKALPDSMQQLSCLRRLHIEGCPELVQWCESGENWMKLSHIEKKILNGKPSIKSDQESTESDQESESQVEEKKTGADEEFDPYNEKDDDREPVFVGTFGAGELELLAFGDDSSQAINVPEGTILNGKWSIESDKESESQVEETKLEETMLGALPVDEEYDPYNKQHVRQPEFFDFFAVGEPTPNDQNQQQQPPQWAQARQDTMQLQQNHVMEEEIVLTLALPKAVNNHNVGQRLLGDDLSLAINVPEAAQGPPQL